MWKAMVKANWTEAFAAIAERLQGVAGERIGAIAGSLADAESMLALKDLMSALGSQNLDCRQDGTDTDVSRRDFYSFNTSIAGIEEADAILLVGTNPRTEAPLVNARIRKRWLAGGLKVAAIGPAMDLTYPVQMLGDGPGLLAGLRDGSHPFAGVLKGAKKPMLILGAGALARADGAAILAACWALAAASNMLTPEWHGFNVLHTAASRVGGLDLGFLPGKGGIVIEDDVWIGANCVLLDGATLRRGCVIAAGTLVKGECEAYTVYAGNPARPIGKRA